MTDENHEQKPTSLKKAGGEKEAVDSVQEEEQKKNTSPAAEEEEEKKNNSPAVEEKKETVDSVQEKEEEEQKKSISPAIEEKKETVQKEEQKKSNSPAVEEKKEAVESVQEKEEEEEEKINIPPAVEDKKEAADSVQEEEQKKNTSPAVENKKENTNSVQEEEQKNKLNKNKSNSQNNNEAKEIPGDVKDLSSNKGSAVTDASVKSEVSLHTPTPNEEVSTRASISTNISSKRSIKKNQPKKIASTRSILSVLKGTFENLKNHKELKGKHSATYKLLERTITEIDDTLKTDNPKLDSIIIFEALRASCRTKITPIIITALDGLSRLFSFQLLDEKILVNPPNSMASTKQEQEPAEHGITPPPKQKLVDAAIDTITDCFEGESTDQKVELQIVRCLTSCILMEDSMNMCHGQSLLKAVRTIYNIFIFSLSSSNQGIAQAALIQVINLVFDRIKLDNYTKDDISNAPVSEQNINGNGEAQPLTLTNMNKLNDEEEQSIDENKVSEDELSEEHLVIKDAFLVFRSMSKISAKPLDSDMDLRSHAVRSKLLSLHVIHSILREHIDVFLNHNLILKGRDEMPFIDATRQYLCLSISRNAASPITPVYEITLEIMWLLISNLRYDFKREIPVFLTEIYLPIADLKTSTPHQKRYFLDIIQRLCNDPRTIIEFYINYDCDSRLPNIVELIVDYLSRMSLTRVDITDEQKEAYDAQAKKPLATYNLSQLPLLSISNLSSSSSAAIAVVNDSSGLPFPIEFALKMSSLNCIVAFLRSLSSWAHKALTPYSTSRPTESTRNRSSTVSSFNLQSSFSGNDSYSTVEEEVDDPAQFENLKMRKTLLAQLVKLFNVKPKKAIPELINKKFIKDASPTSIAHFLLTTDNLDLASVGDYLGEGDEKNIAVMHAFVDELDFRGSTFLDALRLFLQKFRLPGEGQKIDRFMMKFAERFVVQNPGVFAKSDTAYVLAYSVIMLNTDLHSPQIKHRMSLEEFIENTEGIDNGNDLPKEYIVGLYNEISKNEIKLLSEQHQALLNGGIKQIPAASAFSFFNTRDLNREAYMQISKEISSKSEIAFKKLSESKENKDDIFYSASHVEHVKSVFETLWMSFLASLTPPFQDYDDEVITSLCLEGLKISIMISATFGIEIARTSFIGALIQFANLQNIQEMKVKNVHAIITLLEVSLVSGNFLRGSWKDILFVVSQVERLQLLSKGIDRTTIPDVNQSRLANHRSSFDSTRSSNMSFFERWTKKSSPTEIAQEKYHNQSLPLEMSRYISSSALVVLVDRVFSESSNLSGNAIIDFITALTQVSFEEIESSQDSAQPRMFSLQKMIDVCYYNMDRIRVEWTPLWAVMGAAFIKIATNPNLAVVFFAIDSLRQLSNRFLDVEELSGFEFQCDFLRPFRYIVQSTTNSEVQEMCLECFRSFILSKSDNLKSGWKPILEALQFTAMSPAYPIVSKTRSIISYDIGTEHFANIFKHEDSFQQYIFVFKEICKNKKFQKPALQSLGSLKTISSKIADISFKNKDSELLKGKDLFQDIWFPLLFAYNDVIMTAEDLEVRSRALNNMFDALVQYGGEFDDIFWEKVCNKLLFPIFSVLSKHWEINQFNSHDDLSVWLSTTLIQALRNMIALFTHYFDSLNGLLSGFLGLLVSCICQENDTIARIGRSCLQQLIVQNMSRFKEEHWNLITEAFSRLFALTTASELFDSDPYKQGRKTSTRNSDTDEGADQHSSPATVDEEVERAHKEEISEDVGNAEPNDKMAMLVAQNGSNGSATKRLVQTKSSEDLRRRITTNNAIVIKCVLQLMVIESLSELFEQEEFLNYVPFNDVIKITYLLQRSYEFSRDFNDDYELRTRLVEARVVDKIPNLLKQESSSAAVLINIMFRLYLNDESQEKDVKNELLNRIIDICVHIIKRYVSFDESSNQKNINTMRPVIVEILQGYYEFDDTDFKENCSVMYSLILKILIKTLPSDLRTAIRLFLTRVGQLYLELDVVDEDVDSDNGGNSFIDTKNNSIE
ncbi:related to Protein transport protein SEC7 [Saccharomycodes ludwigii]|uniref:Related to Protein transport protein SEC7 n=1 Tax=Saccharomycodes ludwigii TaxID=36035 RepID=A0A376B4R2_9ASCO|nr:related to Protein transport protein SEC7 [Saccharomycodes ludwigii]